MEIITEPRARQILGPYHDTLVDCFRCAFRDYLTVIMPILPVCSARGRRVFLNELIVKHVKLRLGNEIGITQIETYGRFLLSFRCKEGLVTRFKMLNKKLRTANYPTTLSLKFDKQTPALPGIPLGDRLTVGYQFVNQEETDIRVLVVASIGNEVEWDYSLADSAFVSKADVVSMPPSDAKKTATEQPKKRVRGKRPVPTISPLKLVKGTRGDKPE